MRRLVCLHGFTGDPGSWDAVLAALPADAVATCPPIVGHDPDLPLVGTSFDDEVERLARAVRRAGGERLHLAGYSLGGRLALGLLVRHRELFASATLIGAHPGLGSKRERRERVKADEALARRLEKEGVERFVRFWEELPIFASQRGLPPEALAAQRQRRLGHRAAGLAHALRTLGLGRMPSYRCDLPRLDLPVQLMVGEHDEKFVGLAAEMAGWLPRATVEVVPGVGHNLLLEAPAEVAMALRSADRASRHGLTAECAAAGPPAGGGRCGGRGRSRA